MRKLENEEINILVNANNTTNQLCQRCESHRQKLWQSVYRKSDVLRLVGGFGRKRRFSKGGVEVKGKR